MKARLYYFNKETHRRDKRAFDRLYRDLHCVTRANDPSKLIADNALTVLTNLVSMLSASPNKMICINQDFLSDITGKEADQNGNLLKQLKDIISYKYRRMVRFEGKRYNYCYIIEFTEDGEKRASNPELFYSIDSKINLVRRGKKFGLIAEKIRASYISNIREIKREREEEPLGYYSSLSPNNIKTRAREAEVVPILRPSFEKEPQKQITTMPTPAIGFINEPAGAKETKELHKTTPLTVTAGEESQRQRSHQNREPGLGLSLLQDIPLLASLLDPSIQDVSYSSDPSRDEEVMDTNTTPKNKEITPMKAYLPPSEPKANMEFELSGAVFRSFGNTKCEEIMEHCKFNLLDSNKLGVRMSDGFTLSVADKELLKTCIRSVYGETINIVSSTVTALKIVQPETPITPLASFPQTSGKWDQFKKGLLSFFPENTGQHILTAWFNKLRVSEDKAGNKIILTGSSFYIDNIYRRFGAAIEHIVQKSKVTVELHFEDNDEKPIIYKAKV